MKILESFHCVDKIQIRFPKSKKKRIRNKWAKRIENFKFVPWKHLIQFEGKFLGHPLTVRHLKDGFQVINSQNRFGEVLPEFDSIIDNVIGIGRGIDEQFEYKLQVVKERESTIPSDFKYNYLPIVMSGPSWITQTIITS